MSTLQKICLCITIIGGINWGLVGLLDFNLVGAIFGGESIIQELFIHLLG